MKYIEFWRVYSSDLSRARDTAKLALRLQNDTSSIRIDERLRERAYGAREGLSRLMSLEEAIAYRAANGMDDDSVGHYETEQDLMDRCMEWLQGIIQEAQQDAKQRPNKPLPRRVVAFSHAGFIRGVLLHCLGKDVLERHPKAHIADCYRSPKYLIPNTGVSVLDIYTDVDEEDSDGSMVVELAELNCTQHLPSEALALAD